MSRTLRKISVSLLLASLILASSQPTHAGGGCGQGGAGWICGAKSAFTWGEPFQVQQGSPLDRLTHWLLDPIREVPEIVYQYGIRIGEHVFLPGKMGGTTPAEKFVGEVTGEFAAEMALQAAMAGVGKVPGGLRSGLDTVKQGLHGMVPELTPAGAGIPGARIPNINPPRKPGSITQVFQEGLDPRQKIYRDQIHRSLSREAAPAGRPKLFGPAMEEIPKEFRGPVQELLEDIQKIAEGADDMVDINRRLMAQREMHPLVRGDAGWHSWTPYPGQRGVERGHGFCLSFHIGGLSGTSGSIMMRSFAVIN